jgi:hypothetical protein
VSDATAVIAQLLLQSNHFDTCQPLRECRSRTTKGDRAGAQQTVLHDSLQRGVMRLCAQPPPGSKRRAQNLFKYHLGDDRANADKGGGSGDHCSWSHPD